MLSVKTEGNTTFACNTPVQPQSATAIHIHFHVNINMIIQFPIPDSEPTSLHEEYLPAEWQKDNSSFQTYGYQTPLSQRMQAHRSDSSCHALRRLLHLCDK